KALAFPGCWSISFCAQLASAHVLRIATSNRGIIMQLIGSRRGRRFAFTLVELLVVVGIIALLIAILLPVLNKARRAAQNAQCISNLRQIGHATMLYRADAGRLPLFFILRNAPYQPVAQNSSGNAIWWTAFSQGGKTTHDAITRGYIEDGAKPLNQYLYKDA